MNWFTKHKDTIRRIGYTIPILIASFVSIFHVITWYGLSNPMSWAIYLSAGIEVAALSALTGIVSYKVNKAIYVPFIIVTLIQFIGNMFFCYQFIDISTETFKDWVELSGPVFDYIGVIDSGNMIGHKRLLAFLAGGLLPFISLSFLHLLVKDFDDESETIVLDDDPDTNDDVTISGDTENNSDDSEEKNIKKKELSDEDLKKIKEKENQKINKVGHNKEKRSDNPNRLVFRR